MTEQPTHILGLVITGDAEVIPGDLPPGIPGEITVTADAEVIPGDPPTTDDIEETP